MKNYKGFVYDLETEDGNFVAGIGEIDVKNTDSTMVSVPALKDNPKNVWKMAIEMERDINGYPDELDSDGNIVKKGKEGIFPPPLNLEAEKMMRGLFMKKKNYMYMEYDEKGDIILEKNSDVEQLNVKGVILARRDNCHWVRNIYEKMTRGIFAEKTVEESFDMIIDAVVEVIELTFDITSELSIVKAMGFQLQIYHVCFSHLFRTNEKYWTSSSTW